MRRNYILSLPGIKLPYPDSSAGSVVALLTAVFHLRFALQHTRDCGQFLGKHCISLSLPEFNGRISDTKQRTINVFVDAAKINKNPTI
jgi:hypothetical protein